MNHQLFLPLSLGGVMATVLLLPSAGKIAESAIDMKLPVTLGDWQFQIAQATKKEVDILAKDTTFSKAICLAPIPDSYAANGQPNAKRIDLSVVLSGIDINNSIHRPERCMPSQGHQIYSSRSDLIVTGKGRTFPVRELTSTQTIPLDDKGEKTISLDCLTAYFFVGQKTITEDHLRRTLIDMKDRLTRGQDQRWAYVSASMWFSDKGEHGLPSRESAEKEIRQFLADLADRNIDWKQVELETALP